MCMIFIFLSVSAEQPTQEVENSTETVKETVQQTETGGAESAQQETVKQTETGGAESAQQETVKQTETGGAESAQQETVKQTETGVAESAQQENQVSAAVETPSESSGADATASEDAVKPSEEGAPSDNLQAGDSAVPTVTDPLLVDIDRLIEGKEVFEPTAETEEEMAENKHGKKDKKKRGKEVTIETIATAMKSLPPDEQVATVLSKYAELADNNRQLQSALKGIKKQVENISREKETMEAEHSKIVLTKARLESLCRELQKQNKLIKDENVTRLKEEEERRKEVSAKFNTTLSEISNLMKENSDKNNRLRDENQDMAGRLQDLVKQYEAREQHVEKILKAKDLQCQLAEAKLAKQQIELTENKEKMLLEKKALLEDISSYQVKLQTMSENEISLRTQLNSYMEKYEEFQTTLERSNKIFNTFKKEMDEMTKKIKKLEKETKTWKERWEGANKALLDMVTERSELEKKLETQARQNAQLQNLCRALQEQVTELRKQNKTSAASEMKIEALTEALNASEVVTEVVNGTDAVKEEIPEEVASISMISENDSSSGKDQTPIAESGEAETCTSAEAINGAASDQTTVDTPVVKSEDAVKVNYLDVD